MRRIIISLFTSLTLNTGHLYADFLCRDVYLFSIGVSGRSARFFSSAEACQKAISRSKNGFLCKGNRLHTIKIPSFAGIFRSEGKCWEAVEKSRNGFLCRDRYLYTVGVKGYTGIFDTHEDCMKSLRLSH